MDTGLSTEYPVNLVNSNPSSKKDDNLETLYTVNFKETSFTYNLMNDHI